MKKNIFTALLFGVISSTTILGIPAQANEIKKIPIINTVRLASPDACGVGACGEVITETLNVRSTPNDRSNNNIIGQLNRGESIDICSTSNGWHKISYNGRVAYVSSNSRYVKITGAV